MNMHFASKNPQVFRARAAALILTAFLGSIVFGSSAFALTVERIAVKLNTNAELLTSLAVTLKRTVRNVGAGGIILQSFTDEERVWLSKPGRIVKRKVGQDEQLWDCTEKKRARKVPSGVFEEPYEGTVEEVLPSVLIYVAYPQYVLKQMKISGFTTKSTMVYLVGRRANHLSKHPERARWELGIDLDKGVISEVRTFNAEDQLVERVYLVGWTKQGDCFLPSQIVVERHAAQNILTMNYVLTDLVVNNVNAFSLRLK